MSGVNLFSVPMFIGLILLLAGPALFILSLRWFKEDEYQDRLSEFVTDQSAKPKAWVPISNVRTRGLTGSMLSRLFLPWIKGIGGFFGRITPTSFIQNLSRRLTVAGNPMGLEAREFFGISMALLIVGAWVGVTFLRRGLERNNILVAVLSVGIAYIFPRVWLSSKMRARQDKIRKGLPDALDMLSVCASAGLGFDQAMQRVSEHWNTPVGIEFARMMTEMEMGLSRRDALRNMAERLDVSELTSFVSFIIQSDQLGMSLVETLHAQADQLRVERRHRAQEQAQKIPTKMLIPMAFLIFPALLAIILGPVVPNVAALMGVMGR